MSNYLAEQLGLNGAIIKYAYLIIPLCKKATWWFLCSRCDGLDCPDGLIKLVISVCSIGSLLQIRLLIRRLLSNTAQKELLRLLGALLLQDLNGFAEGCD